jgi:hypothetical protein
MQKDTPMRAQMKMGAVVMRLKLLYGWRGAEIRGSRT